MSDWLIVGPVCTVVALVVVVADRLRKGARDEAIIEARVAAIVKLLDETVEKVKRAAAAAQSKSTSSPLRANYCEDDARKRLLEYKETVWLRPGGATLCCALGAASIRTAVILAP